MSRRGKLLSEINAVKSAYEDSCVSGLKFDGDETITFEINLGTRVPFTLSVADYPNSCLLFTADDCISYPGSLSAVFKSAVTDRFSKAGLPCPELPLVAPVSGEEEGNRSDSEVEEEWGSEGDWFSESEEHLGAEGEYHHELLKKDMELFRKKYGETSLSFRDFASIDTLDIDLSFDVSWLDRSIADAWAVNASLPIVARLTLSPSMYLRAAKPPKVDVFQVEREWFGLKSQLTKIGEAFVSKVWREEDSGMRSSGNSLGNTKSKGKREAKDSREGLGSFEDIVVPPARDNEVAMLLEMGFDLELARNVRAAVSISVDVEEATRLLLNNPERCSTEAVLAAQSDLALLEMYSPPSSKGKGKGKEGRTGETKGDAGRPLDLGEWARHEEAAEAERCRYPPRRDGFLVQFVDYLVQRIPSLSNYCVICDHTHLFANGLMLKPAVCSRELCCFAFQKLGVMSDAADAIATEAEVVDLLICMARAAAASSRKEIIFDPFPTLLDPADPRKVILSPKDKDFGKLNRILDSFPAVHSLAQARDCLDMKSKLERSDRLAYPLLQWLISSNRSHIVKLPREKHLPSMNTDFQFVLLSSPPGKEARFRELREKHGSTFAFHGSGVENWHSILRNGLYNASGTKFQVNGAAHGAGIYLAPNMSTSLGYCRASGSGKGRKSSDTTRFLGTSNFCCVALCEVIDTEIRKSGGIWVSPKAEYVVTRFFFVYEGGASCSAATSSGSFLEEISRALS